MKLVERSLEMLSVFEQHSIFIGGPILPFWRQKCLKVPFRQKTKETYINSGSKVLPGLFTGLALNAGGYWTGDLFVVDSEDVEKTSRN